MAPPPPATTTTRRSAPRRLSIVMIAVVAVAALVALGAIGVTVTSFLRQLGQTPPTAGTLVMTAAGTAAQTAATDPNATDQERAAASLLAAELTAVWLTPEADGVDAIGERVASLAAEARGQSATLALVVYGIPHRDCGQTSSGGAADAAAYHAWTAAMGAALKVSEDVRTVIVLEPDSLALAPQCGDIDERVPELQSAIDDLAGANRWIYLDGGHSAWLPATQMASLIGQVGRIDRVRGFATNVANYQSTDAEVAYAHAVAAALPSRMHAVIDTGRNGAGGAPTEWCNPPGRLVGERSATIGDDVVDTNLWIKPPGESDGPCRGGPAAGRWWPDAAVELTRNERPA